MRILIVDDHPAFRAGLQALVSTIPGAEVCGEAATGSRAAIAARTSRPDVVLMDIDMPGMDGLQGTREVLAACPETSVLVLTIMEDLDTILAALRAGASGYLLKGADRQEIVKALEAVSRGAMTFGSCIADQIVERLTRPATEAVPFKELTDRERAVLQLVAEGKKNAEIAQELCLSTKTVRNYMSRIFAKLRVSHRAEAAVVARREGLGA